MKRISIPVRGTKRAAAFSLVELFAVVATLALLAGVVIPVLAAADPKARNEVCQNNLKKIGVALHMYSELHMDRMPWRVPKEEGGTYSIPIAENAWAQFLFISNHLASPEFLACPADRVKPAADWGRDAGKGFLHMQYRGNAVSYFVGLDVRPEAPNSLLSGDGNLQPSAIGQSCDYTKVKSAASLSAKSPDLKWKPGRHGSSGNILFYDGRVENLFIFDLRKALDKSNAYHPESHSLLP